MLSPFQNWQRGTETESEDHHPGGTTGGFPAFFSVSQEKYDLRAVPVTTQQPQPGLQDALRQGNIPVLLSCAKAKELPQDQHNESGKRVHRPEHIPGEQAEGSGLDKRRVAEGDGKTTAREKQSY